MNIEHSSNLRPNHLVHEKSPYLLQHAYNPVEWYPWGTEAFERAKRENKPIFLSIGYSTCHWCHIMEHESFENQEIAKILNDYFVSIKVDREERPDLDQIYMTATQAMTGSGGWPMSVWLNHDLQPFYTGTYFPPENRYGRPGFPEILKHIHEIWVKDRAKVDAAGKSMTDLLKEQMNSEKGDVLIPPSVIAEAYQYFQRSFDHQWGGFGSAPKFPRAVQFPFLFRYHAATGDHHALEMALFTLRKMAQGGMYDQLGGGFARYSVDAEWRVPHFEKMLYDNGQLLSVYTEAWQISRDDFYQRIARDIIRYIARDMTSKEGAFYSAEDADSEGKEGAFYVWTEKEVRSILSDDAANLWMAYYDFHAGGNFEHGKNVLHNVHLLQEIAQKFGKTESEARIVLEKSKGKLFEVRCKRPRPHLDDKIITAWNGLMISGMAFAARVFDEKDFLERAIRASDFILTRLRDPKTGYLLRRYRDGEAKGAAFLDDYAFFTAGLLNLFEASQDPRWLKEAIHLTKEQIQLFWDEKRGGFYFARDGDSTLLMRPKADYEGAEPSGNSIAALNLLRLARLTDQREYHDKAERTIKALSANIRSFPASMPMMLCAFSDSMSNPQHIIIMGDSLKKDTQAMWREVNSCYLPNTTLLFIDIDENESPDSKLRDIIVEKKIHSTDPPSFATANYGEVRPSPSSPQQAAEYSAKANKNQIEMAKILPFLSTFKALDGKATAYICQNYACQKPTNDFSAFKEMLVKLKR